MNYIKSFAPATVANVACGFDIFGFAIEEPGDVVEITRTDSKEIVITNIIGDEGRLPRDAQKNAVTGVMFHMLKHLGIKDFGAEVILHKNMPLGSGMGSSAASSVAGVMALNALLGNPFSKNELLPFAMEGERIASGSAHADNVGPSLLGGFVVIRSYTPLDVFTIPIPGDLYCTLVHPDIEINTKDARYILREEVSLQNTITQMGNVAGMVAGLINADYDLIGRSMVDVIIEPVRSILIPEFDRVKNAAMETGSLGCSISGSGPSMFALSRGKDTALKVGESMVDFFKNAGIESHMHVSGINSGGAKILSQA